MVRTNYAIRHPFIYQPIKTGCCLNIKSISLHTAGKTTANKKCPEMGHFLLAESEGFEPPDL